MLTAGTYLDQMTLAMGYSQGIFSLETIEGLMDAIYSELETVTKGLWDENRAGFIVERACWDREVLQVR